MNYANTPLHLLVCDLDDQHYDAIADVLLALGEGRPALEWDLVGALTGFSI